MRPAYFEVTRRVERTFALPDKETVTIAAVSDTHSKPHPRIDERLAALAPDLILHGGDIGDLAVLRALEAHAPVIAVRGNIDALAPDVPDELALALTRGPQTALRILLTHIAVNGPRLRADVRKRAAAAGADLVVCGHSHVPFMARDGAMTVFNPGSIGPRRFQLPITFGVLTLAGGKVRLQHVDTETGRPWTPGTASG